MIDPKQNESNFSETQLSNMENSLKAQSEQRVMDIPKIDVNKPFRLGIMLNESNNEDVLFYNNEFREINRLYGHKINLIFIGYKKENDNVDLLNGVNFFYLPPTSIVHYFKQLKALELDLMFIPLINEPNTKMELYNRTSEDTKKWQEASLFKIPILVSDIYPYNSGLIKPDWDGFIYPNRSEFMTFFMDLFENKFASIKAAGHYAHERAKQLYYSKDAGEQLMRVFTMAGAE